MTCSYYHELKFLQKQTVLLKWFENLNLPLIITGLNFLKTSQCYWCNLLANLNGPYYYKLPFSPRKDIFNDITWPASNITSSNFFKNSPYLMKLLEYLSYPYHHQVILLQKKSSSVDVTWKLDLSLISRADIFVKIRQCWWCHLSLCTAPIITSWHFLQK